MNRATALWYCELNCEQKKIYLKDKEDTQKVEEKKPQQSVSSSN